MAADEKLILKDDNETVHNAKVECLVECLVPLQALLGEGKREPGNDCMCMCQNLSMDYLIYTTSQA